MYVHAEMSDRGIVDADNQAFNVNQAEAVENDCQAGSVSRDMQWFVGITGILRTGFNDQFIVSISAYSFE